MREAAALHEVLDRQALGRDRRLRQEAEPLAPPRASGSEVISAPSSRTAPAVGFSSRANARSSVDLPHAFAPTIAVIWPGGQRHVDAVQDVALAVADASAAGAQAHAVRLRHSSIAR